MIVIYDEDDNDDESDEDGECFFKETIWYEEINYMHKKPCIVFIQYRDTLVEWSFQRLLETMCYHVYDGHNHFVEFV